ncbi:PLD nuclease N-terminal domain-containing protein [Actinomarinicola tropica]|uniref:Cardiolipin synthase N-terminal domain-containing protein n=1 Tax=Actinomarinicola tropica TaxID=2789776 RepID=A0A5Q2RKW6_9ACTN|nr:PLD nuclease N-terminal domain-containing protein [Actinomarinicola tropica]QGG94500.1 hypothetical protein GH723_04935 [Actinomarinicola tropica]
MFRVLFPSVGAIVVFAIWLFAVFDVISTDEVLVRNLPKVMWLVFVIFVPLVGSIAWLILGRPLYAGWQPGGQTQGAPRPRYVAPEDRPDFGRSSPGPSAEDLRRWEDDLARREQELRRRDEDEPPV